MMESSLTISGSLLQCLAKGLGEDYCKQRVRLDDTNTKLWNYGTRVVTADLHLYLSTSTWLMLLLWGLDDVS